MSSADTLHVHLQLCDELHQLCLEENKFIKESLRSPEPGLIARRETLLKRLDESLGSLKESPISEVPADRMLRERRRDVVEKSRTRILQILHLQRENEQLVLRYSMGAPKPTPTPPAVPATQLQKLYDRHR